MLKKTIKFTDFNGIEREEDFYFNLTEAELTEMELSTTGGLAENIQRIIIAKDIPSMAKIIKDLIMRSYGEKSPDGRGFFKSQERVENFLATDAFSILYMELISNADSTAAFINGIIPAKLAEKVAEAQANGTLAIPNK